MTIKALVGRAGAILVVVALIGGGSYWYVSQPKGPVARAMVPPPAEVGVVQLAPADVNLPLQYAGRVAGFRSVEIRAQVGGILLKREYTDGATVKQGDVLFRIDPRGYEATVARATAQVAQAQATVVQTEENFERVQDLVARGVGTKKSLEDATAARSQGQATLQAAQADLQTARLNLEYTVVKAPISGPTGLTSPPEGTLVQAQQTLLTTLTQTDPAYVLFNITDTELRSLQEVSKSGKTPLTLEDIPVQLRFGDGTIFPREGKIDTRSRTVDVRTGTIQVRAVFSNEDSGILPGQFVRVNLLGVTMSNALLVPKPAISQGPQGAFVYVLDANETAQIRPVRLDREVPTGWIVREGVKAGDRIVVDGIIRVRPGAKVKPVPAATPPVAPQPAGAKP
ncbi:MAG: efflux RND transporter periplasmic adaptor subunit [Alphaproteobacteria bacterium]|nr:efflux RND transporter periplasmic adaptor subunit [Alphaproteobacteria bacterium]